jgi:hypothetical protein
MMDLPKEASKEALSAQYEQATKRLGTKEPLGTPQPPAQHYGVAEKDLTEEMLEPIENLYEGLGKLGAKMDFIEYADEKAEKGAAVDAKNYTAAPILEIRNPPSAGAVGNWFSVAKEIYDAVENSILYPEGSGLFTKARPFRNVLTPGQEQRGAQARDKAARLKDRFRILDEWLEKERAPGVESPEKEKRAFGFLCIAAREAAENRTGTLGRYYGLADEVLPKARWSKRMQDVDGAIGELIESHAQMAGKKPVAAGNLYLSASSTLKRFGVAI